MRRRVRPAFLWGMAVSAAAQPGVTISMPPNAHQTAPFTFTNRCPTKQTYLITTHPQAEWLRFEPSTVEAGAATSFEVQVTVNTFGTQKQGAYQSSLAVVCSSCSASEPPCLVLAEDIPFSLTIANIEKAGEFVNTARPTAPAPNANAPTSTKSIAPESKPIKRRFIPLAAVAVLLMIGATLTMLAAIRKLYYRSTPPDTDPQGPAESERHRVRW